MADASIKLSGTYDSIEAYELLEEMRGVASDYLPLTGGEISGDLIVDGQLSAKRYRHGRINRRDTWSITHTCCVTQIKCKKDRHIFEHDPWKRDHRCIDRLKDI